MEPATVLPIIGVVAAPLLSYLVAKRKSSGRIETTDAERLWTEAESLRRAYKDERFEDRVELQAMRAELASLRAELAVARAELAAALPELAAARAEANALRIEVDQLRTALTEKGH